LTGTYYRHTLIIRILKKLKLTVRNKSFWEEVNNKGEKASKGRKGKYRRKVEEFTKENAIASLWPAKVFIVTENEKCTSHLTLDFSTTRIL
jgi:hypothetical protein